MESAAMHRRLVVLAVAALLCGAAAAASAQQVEVSAQRGGPPPNQGSGRFEFDGSWAPTQSEDVSNDTLPVDYMALPLTDAARARALSYDDSQLGMIERQCEGWSQPYIFTGPFGLKVWSDFEPVKVSQISYTIGAWLDKPAVVIWMDGRPHPSQYAEHTRSGFTTGRWDGNTLVTVTTHMKNGLLRKNGVPVSDLTKMTMRFHRHGTTLLVIGIIEDPIYLAEPLVWTRNYVLAETPMEATVPPCVPAFEGGSFGSDTPHFLWERNPYVDELTKQYGVPQEAVLGYPRTLYPEYRKKLKRQ